MDWFGDKLSRLIEEGKRALGQEVVVMSEVQEDEVDDGSGNWVEENDGPSTSTSKYTPITPNYSTATSSSSRFSSPSIPIARHGKGRSEGNYYGSSLPSTPLQGRSRGLSTASECTPASSSVRESEAEWQSPHIRDSMERARAAYRQKRGLGLDLG